MIKRNLNNELEYLANINFLGNEFFKQENYLDNICCNLGIELDVLKDYREGIHYIQEKLCNESLLVTNKVKTMQFIASHFSF